MSFDRFKLHPQITKAIDSLGWEEPTAVQLETIAPAIEGKDLKVRAQTGSGKTAAFLLPLFHHLINNPSPKTDTRALILVPTRELANQVWENCKEIGRYSHINAICITGGEEFKYQAAMLRKNPEIIIATPGRLADHIARKSVILNDVEFLILDEADRMLDMGFSEDIERVANECPEQHPTWLFSATMNAKGMGAITRNLLNKPYVVDTQNDEAPQKIHQVRILADDTKHKDRLTNHLLKTDDFTKALIFTNTRDQAEKVSGYLKYHNFNVDVLHGEKQQDLRKRLMTAFRSKNLDVLVATDVAARGLDIDNVDLVINYDIPRSGDEYLHRIGRTGRAGAEGTAISFVAERDWNLMASIERYLGITTELRKISSLASKFTGPKKVKASGKAAKSKKKTKDKVKTKSADTKKPKKRDNTPAPSSDGFGMIRKKKSSFND